MQVQQLPIYQFLEGSGKSFIIPVYQRDYAWTRINCQKLWDDLVSISNSSRSDHFLGTLVTIGSGFQEYTIIDGQQRLTTVSLLLLALHSYLKDKVEKNESEIILTEQLLDFLINKYSSDQDKRIRLKPNKEDKEHFEKLFENSSSEVAGSNIINNYNFFYEKISAEKISPKDIFDSFRKFQIVLIDLVRGHDDPQLIFESLNSTGVDLTAGDLIRNYILMDLEPAEQERMYKKYWAEIERLTGDVAEYIRNYLIYKTKLWVKKDDVYLVFKKFALENFYKDKEGILQDLVIFAEIYSWLIQIKSHSNTEINEKLKRVYKLEFTVCYPYLLDLFYELRLDNIDEKTTAKAITIIESYAFRKMIVDNTTQGLNKLFITLARDIKKEDSWKERYIDILGYILLEKKVSQRFPTDEEFENALVYKEIYKFQSKNRNFLLESLENFNSAYTNNLDDLTVEHIMPQTLTKEWKNRLGENWSEVHGKYLHTLGNLSLTSKNSELSNNTFEEKQQIDFQTSKLKLNFKLDGLTVWNETKILERAKDLIKDAKNIWPYPTTTYTRPVPEEQIFDITCEDNFSGSKPSRIYLGDEDIKGTEVKTWRDVLINTCQFLYNFSPTQFEAIQNSPEFQWYFDVSKPLRNKLEFMPNKYIEGNISSNNIILFLAKISDRIGYPADKIQFSIKS